MPTYVYGCDEHPEHRVDVVHSIIDNPLLPCEVCQKPMHRIPQAIRFYMNPGLLLLDKMQDRFNQYRVRKKNEHKRRISR